MKKRYLIHLAIGLLAIAGILSPGGVSDWLQARAQWFLTWFDWLTLAISSGAVVACLAAAIGPWGRLRLGPDTEEPEFSRISWFAMLFAAGMGAGLVFWGAAEPLIFTVSPPPGGAPAQTPAAIRDAYALTMFHWALQAWAIYAAAALAVGYMAFRAGKPPLPSVVFPFLPAWAKIAVDMVALLAVIFGVVASLGQGGLQMGAGAERISGIDGLDGPMVRVVIVIVLAAVFLASAWGGLKRGIEPLSNLNMVIAIALALFVFTAGPTWRLVGDIALMAGAYVQQILPLSVELRPEGPPRDWTRAWSLTYFLWWVAWTPFVSVFIARISRGRTIREFILGVVLVPCLVTLIWFGVFGGTAVWLQLTQGVDLGVSDFATAPAATYALLEHLPLTMLAQIAAFALIFIFMVTSADSGAYVMAMFSARTHTVPPRLERLFWGAMLALLTIGAMLADQGQDATRAFAVVGAIPLTILMAAQIGVAGVAIVRDWRRRAED